MMVRPVSLITACALALLAGMSSEDAQAKAPIYSFEVTPTTTQAGGHPDLITDISLGNSATQPAVPCWDCNGAEEITVNTPAGLIGSPRDVPRCTQAEFALSQCPVDSQVGLVCLDLQAPAPECTIMPLYNMVPQAGQAALVAFPVPVPLALPIYTSFTVRTESDYGLEAKSFGIPRRFGSFPLSPNRLALIFWGVPSDSSHDALRTPASGYGVFGGPPTLYFFCNGVDPVDVLVAGKFPYPECVNLEADDVPPPTPSNAPRVPFLSNPTACVGPQIATVATEAYDGESDIGQTIFPPITGCDKLNFRPSLTAAPTTTQADAPSGLDVDLTAPSTPSATTPSPSHIRAITITLPPGFTTNPNAANGKVGCTDEQARFGTRDPAQCPEHSKIGTLEIETTSLPGTLPGALYLGEPLPGDRYRLVLTADHFGLHIKQIGSADPDPDGMTITFNNLPQTPFQRMDLHVFGAERGILATPTKCGTYPVVTEFVPWSYPEVPKQTSTQFFEITSGPNESPCPGDSRPFEPRFAAGVPDNTAGASSPFIVHLSREDGHQFLSGVDVSLPPGFSAKLKGVPYCPETAIETLRNPLYLGLTELAATACPTASQIGTATAVAGAGSRPLAQPGKVYLAGPYKGGPLSLVVVVPAVTGPYDLGNVVVRVAVYVDPVTARVSTVSDPLPQSLDDIPLRARQVLVGIDKSDFSLNPTNCAPLSVDATLSGAEGGAVDRSSHFQVANCGMLGFAPKLNLRLRGSTKRRGHPALRAVLSARPGDANLSGASVALPGAAILDQANIGEVCTRAQFAAEACPEGAIYGRATAFTPILEEPLEGPVYLRSSDNKLPDMVMDLHGQVDFNAIARVDSVRGGIRTTFDFLPDVPLSKVVVSLQGGKKGLLLNTRDMCLGERPSAVARLSGQNGARQRTRLPLRASCGRQTNRGRSARQGPRGVVMRSRKAG